MKIFDKYNCILCKYNKYNKDKNYGCWDYREKDEYGYPTDECNTLSNIYYKHFAEHFPFKQIDYFLTERAWKKENKYLEEMDERYGDSSLETDEIKFIWGVKSWDDLSCHDANLYTMNDIDITYDKEKKEYMLGVETAYMFKSRADECKYLQDCLNAFTKYMDDNGLIKNAPYMLFMSNPYTSTTAKTIEELYTNFKIFVNGFCSLNNDLT